MDAADEVADLAQRGLGLVVRGGDQLSPALRIVLELVAGCSERGRQRDQTLLCPVMEIALDAAPPRFCRLDT